MNKCSDCIFFDHIEGMGWYCSRNGKPLCENGSQFQSKEKKK